MSNKIREEIEKALADSEFAYIHWQKMLADSPTEAIGKVMFYGGEVSALRHILAILEGRGGGR